jgi:hypothetical protein
MITEVKGPFTERQGSFEQAASARVAPSAYDSDRARVGRCKVVMDLRSSAIAREK